MTTAPYTTGPFVGSVSASMPTHTFGPSINIVNQPLATRSQYTYESNDVVIQDCAEFHEFLKEQDRLDNLDILSKPVLTREKYIMPDDNFVSNCDEFDANLEYDIDGTGLKWVDAVFLSGVDTTKRIKYLNNYGEPVYAEDDDEEEVYDDDDEEDDSRTSFVLFDERSGMGSGMMNSSYMRQSLHPFYNLSRDAEVLTKVDNEVDVDEEDDKDCCETMKVYKFRVECNADYDLIKIVVGDRMVENECSYNMFGGAEVTIESSLSLDQIRRILYSITDAHVATQTVMPIAEYTGERNYDLNIDYEENWRDDEAEDDEEDDRRRSFVLFDERSVHY